ncbi:KPN_02809 family neutral zinc metallopeptidase [Olivibacter sitiensis]|uniref:KPN_02809 family neutral zinc metallopeptidase n=1 Tax=Olivibacter sitiensis TaxID=376470 RepID=UPI000481E40C|nr:neutral zinc metallopeptidase [Olivibacter sitiensis]
MKWKGKPTEGNIEDRRGASGGKGIAIGGGLGAIVIALIVTFLGGDPQEVLQQLQNQQISTGTDSIEETPEEKEMVEFVNVVLTSTDKYWTGYFAQEGQEYQKPVLRLFREQTNTEGCGLGSAAMGPFYCPPSQRVFLDLAFFDELSSRFGAEGDLARAYVIAHEVGHHVQNLNGTMAKVQRLRQQLSESEYNKVSVALELQADFLAGMWVRYADQTEDMIESGDMASALRAASAVGDDALQKQAQGYVVPESFTHGTSEQRVRSFKRGYETGDLSKSDSFEGLE